VEYKDFLLLPIFKARCSYEATVQQRGAAKGLGSLRKEKDGLAARWRCDWLHVSRRRFF